MKVKTVRYIKGYGKEVVFVNHRRIVICDNGEVIREYIGQATFDKYYKLALQAK